MVISKPRELLFLTKDQSVTKRNLFDLIQFSKVRNSSHWDGEENQVGNTPQQGINWIGKLPAVKAVIIKTRPGSYEFDGWVDDDKSSYNYSFKARKDVINLAEKANRVLVDQPLYGYPILLFTEKEKS